MRVFTAVLLLSLTACSGGDSSSPTPAPSPTPVPPAAPTVTGLTISGQGCTASATGNTSSPLVCSATAIGTVFTLTATAKLSDNSTKDVSASAAWATTKADVATVTSSGVVTTKGAGEADITAVYQGKMDGQTVRVTLPPPVPPGPKTTFGPGQHRVNTDIVAGRYFSVPRDGCYFERLRGFSGNLGDIIANEFIGFNAGQWIVDILSSDAAFDTDTDCGTWYNSQRRNTQTTITGGMWLVGGQLAPGTYQANVAYGCYWERLRNFSNEISGVIANDFVSTPGTRSVTIRSTDVGFRSDEECNTWTLVSAAMGDEADVPPSQAELVANKAQQRAHRGPRR